MINYVKAEFLKQKGKSSVKMLWIGPLTTILLAVLLMYGKYFVQGAMNWWYTTLLPGTFALIVAFYISSEKKHNRHGLFSVCENKAKLWLAGVCMNSLLLFGLNMFFGVILMASSCFFGFTFKAGRILLACIVLSITFLWQVPLFMWLSDKAGAFVSIFVCLIGNIGFGIFFSPTRLWYIPFAIPSRLMCPLLHILPNGLMTDLNSPLNSSNVILPGLLITAFLYIFLTAITSIGYKAKEV